MATVGPALSCYGYDPATGKCAYTSIPPFVPPSDYDIYMGGVYQTIRDYTPDFISDALKGIPHIPGATIPIYPDGSIQDAINQRRADGTPLDKAVNGAASSVGSFISLVSDLPRMGTIIVGIIVITAGLFALAGHGDKVFQIRGGPP